MPRNMYVLTKSKLPVSVRFPGLGSRCRQRLGRGRGSEGDHEKGTDERCEPRTRRMGAEHRIKSSPPEDREATPEAGLKSSSGNPGSPRSSGTFKASRRPRFVTIVEESLVEHSLRRPQCTAKLLVLAVIATGILAGCAAPPAALKQLMDARRLASELHVQFTKAGEAANRAVMADTDEASVAAAEEAKRARQAVEQDVDALRPILKALGYGDMAAPARSLQGTLRGIPSTGRRGILPLAVENTNLKAQRLSFGPAREAADSFHSAVDSAVRSVPAKSTRRARSWPQPRGPRCSRSSRCRRRISRNPRTR